MNLALLLVLLATTAPDSLSRLAVRRPVPQSEPAFRDNIRLTSKAGFRVEIVGSALESWVLRDPRGSHAAIMGLASESTIKGCQVAADPAIISGDCGGVRGGGSSFDVSAPLRGDWLLTLTCRHPKCKCGDTRVRFVPHGSQQPTSWDMVTLTGSDSLTWSVHVALDSVAIERLVMAAPSANLVVRVIDSTSGTGVPYANVEINGKTLVSSEEGLVSASVDPGTPCVVRVRALGWAIQAPDTITLVGGQLRDLRHVMQGQPPVVKY